ncbi:MAG TPA: NAD-dependent epimerase/dehydratase family protein [Gammaproteobacteria bacterium]|nr:NAD-dependent epimerase/dehydratase family protein [Gammaproteobacteria bacterium]
MKEKIVVVGSNSFSGASFVDAALKEGSHVIGVSRSAEPHDALLPYKWSPNRTSFSFHQLDLNKNLDEIIEIIHSEKPDYVVNYAAQSMVAQSWEHPEHWYMTNVVSTTRFHEQLRHCDFIKKYVHISTPEVYGNCEGDVQENTNYHPSTPYAISRAAADMNLRAYFDAYKFPVVFTRSANVYGPGQQLYRIIPRTILFIKLGRKLQLHGGGVSERSFIHINDVSDATLRIMRNGQLGGIYHISTKRVISIKALVQLICDRMGASFEDCVETSDERLGKDAAYLLDSTKIRETLGWRDHIQMKEGIDEVIHWVEQGYDELQRLPFDYNHKA